MRYRGFTMIEAIVVILILGVLAAVAMPRLFNAGWRAPEAALDRVEIALSAIAQRQASGNFRMALAYDPEERTLALQRLRLPTDRDGRRIALSRRNAGEWVSDPLAPTIRLGQLEVREVRLDGVELNQRDWRIELVPSETRPVIELDLAATINREERTWRMELLPFAFEPTRERSDIGGRGRASDSLRSIDLDEMGLSEVPWT